MPHTAGGAVIDVRLATRAPTAARRGAVGEGSAPADTVADVEGRLTVGLGAGTPRDIRLAGATLARAAGPDQTGAAGSTSLSVTTPDWDATSLGAFVEGLALGAYSYAARGAALQVVELIGPSDAAPIRPALVAAQASLIARDLANTPALVKTPAWLAQQAVDRLRPLDVQVSVRDEAWLAEQGFGGVLAVGGGSASPPRFVEASWRPRGAGTDHVVVVGKGITFDTGGLNIKPGDSMRTMHTDMAGAAAAVGALHAIATLGVRARVSVLLPIAENSVSGSAYRPSDVIRHYGGRTSEVLNTDAEGRLVLADAMAYAAARLRPSVLVDIATLTGAMKVALGNRTAGFFATEDVLAQQLSVAGEEVDEPLWRMPLRPEYESLLDSSVADAQNAPGNPGGITAALFLRPFAGGVPWAHLDIAGPARSAEVAGIMPRGATGFGARLLARWIENRAVR